MEYLLRYQFLRYHLLRQLYQGFPRHQKDRLRLMGECRLRFQCLSLLAAVIGMTRVLMKQILFHINLFHMKSLRFQIQI
jgi:hypothetical protein